jgi:hypothetical protein
VNASYSVKFELVSTHQSPRVRCLIGGVKVQWRVRPGGYTGWLCDEHGKTDCQHSDVAERFLPKAVVNRMVCIEERKA